MTGTQQGHRETERAPRQRGAADADRLQARIDALGAIGAAAAHEGGGIVRPAYGRAHAEAASLVADWMRRAGLIVGRDEAGTVFGILRGADRSGPALALGSHLDTVPHGGRFDGALGVVAALDAAERMVAEGTTPARDVVVLGFADEEGNNFGIGVLSAQVWIGEVPSERFAAILDPQGRSLASYLERFEIAGVPIVKRPELGAYLEAHVEQGPVLDREGADAAAVSAIVGIARTTVRFEGAANHAGTTPMTLRADALPAAADLVLEVQRLARAQADLAVGTVGVLEVAPGATNVVPGRVELRIELRSPDADVLASMQRHLEAHARSVAERDSVRVALEPWHVAPPVAMDPRLVAATRQGLHDVGLEDRVMPSWAGHDAKVLARRMPVGMLFVPSVEGISHAPGEHTAAKHLAIAADALHASALRALDALAASAERDGDASGS